MAVVSSLGAAGRGWGVWNALAAGPGNMTHGFISHILRALWEGEEENTAKFLGGWQKPGCQRVGLVTSQWSFQGQRAAEPLCQRLLILVLR